jgi:hypothetical protein
MVASAQRAHPVQALASGLYPTDISSIIQSPHQSRTIGKMHRLAGAEQLRADSLRIIRTSAATVAVISMALIARPVARLAVDKSAIAPRIKAMRPAGKVRAICNRRGARHTPERGGQRQACRVRLSDAVPATAAVVTAIASGAADRRNACFPGTPALAGGRAGCSALRRAALVLRGPVFSGSARAAREPRE